MKSLNTFQHIKNVFFATHVRTKFKVYLTKTTFKQMLDCTTKKLWATGSTQKFANPCKSTYHSCNNKKCPTNFFFEMTLPQTVFFIYIYFCDPPSKTYYYFSKWRLQYFYKSCVRSSRNWIPTRIACQLKRFLNI